MVATKRVRLDAKATLTSKGQMTLPKAVRDHFGLKPGQEVEFVEDETGKIYIRRHLDPHRFEKWRGYLARTNPIDMTVDEYIDEIRGH